MGFWASILAIESPFLGGLLVLWSISIPYGPWIMYGLFFIALGLLGQHMKAYNRTEQAERGFRPHNLTIEEVFRKNVED